MIIHVNGEQKEVRSATIAELFEELQVPSRGMVVHVNGTMVHWTKYKDCYLHEYDDIGIVRVIAGG